MKTRRKPPLLLKRIRLDPAAESTSSACAGFPPDEVSGEIYRAIFENTPAACVILDGQGKIVLANAQFTRLAGYSHANEIEGLAGWSDFLPSEEAEHFRKKGLTLGPGELLLMGRDGRPIHTLVTASPIPGLDFSIVSVVDLNEQKRVEQIYKRLAEKMAVLHTISTAASEVDSVDDLIGRATQILEDLFHPDHCGVLLVDPEKKSLHLHPSYRGIKPVQTEMLLSQGISGWVVTHGKTRRVIDARLTPEYIAPAEEMFGSELCAPLKLRPNVIGVINVEIAQPNAFTAEDEDLISTFAVQLATAIERLRSEKVGRHQAEQLAAIDQVSREITSAGLDLEKVYSTIHQAVGKLMPNESFALSLCDEIHQVINGVYLVDKNGRFPPLEIPYGQGLSGQVIASGQTIYIEDIDLVGNAIPVIHFGEPDHIRSVLAVPLRLGMKIIGMMSTQSYHPQAFSQDDVHMLELLSNHAAIALENARLFAETHRQALTFENMFDAIIVVGAVDKRILDWNPAACQMYGYSKAEALGRVVNFIYLPEDKADLGEKIMAGVREDGRWAGEIGFVRKDGTQGISEVVIVPVMGEQGQIVATIGVHRDITQRKEAEDALRTNEALLRLILNSLPIGVWLTDHTGQIFSANPAAKLIWGAASDVKQYQLENFKAWWPKTGEPVQPEEWASELAIQSAKTILNQEVDILGFDGARRTTLNSAIPILDEQKRVDGAIIVNQDMTEEKRREREREAILTVSAALRSASTRDEMVAIIVEQLSTLIVAEGIAVLLQSPEQSEQSYFIAASSGRWNQSLGLMFHPEEKIAHLYTMIHEKQVNIMVDRDLPHPHIPLNQKDYLVSVPLETRDEALGAVWMVKKGEFSPLEVSVTSAVADITANALHRLALYERTSRYADQMRVVNEISHNLTETMDLPSIYSRLAQGLQDLYQDIAGIFISLYEPRSQIITCAYAVADGELINPLDLPTLHLAPPGQGLQSEVIHNRASLIINDLQKTTTSKKHVGHNPQPTNSALFVPMMSHGEVLGVLQIQAYSANRFSQEDADLLGLVANTAAVAIENASLFRELQSSHSELTLAYDSTLEGWAHALELRDQETKEHSQRVVDFTLRLAKRLEVDDGDLVHVRRGALLHDIGKMGISDQILRKEGPLSDEDWVQMRQHPLHAYGMLKSIGYLGPALDIPYCHHEKWDGSGYPRGLVGEQIPLSARIFAVVDVWDALTSDRPYRKAWSEAQALAYIHEQAGKHFDPRIARAFLAMIQEDEGSRIL